MTAADISRLTQGEAKHLLESLEPAGICNARGWLYGYDHLGIETNGSQMRETLCGLLPCDHRGSSRLLHIGGGWGGAMQCSSCGRAYKMLKARAAGAEVSSARTSPLRAIRDDAVYEDMRPGVARHIAFYEVLDCGHPGAGVMTKKGAPSRAGREPQRRRCLLCAGPDADSGVSATPSLERLAVRSMSRAEARREARARYWKWRFGA
jgi:hypothetical protein